MDKSIIMGIIAEALQEIADKLATAQAQALPTVSGSDNGKIMGVSSGEWAAVAPELPAVSGSDNGKLLGVSSGAWAAVAAPTELPAVTASDNGKVLKVVEGVWAAAGEE